MTELLAFAALLIALTLWACHVRANRKSREDAHRIYDSRRHTWITDYPPAPPYKVPSARDRWT